MKRDMKELVAELKRQGWRVEPLRSGHHMAYAPDGVSKVTLAGTPSDHRSFDNTVAKLRQYGFTWKGR